ncbi:PREDICTED: putative B3 domain-containing protein At1g78640 [Ipomoea nil]|uniref:putative B3 domain-containing protein At1g78640 n=1 Tax=Ipomoea nil TaxID=35883 RepID=UPI0009017C8E|nr:PREDICTED: putative B3 domain-containing protein At1g78640 [Ipomoea nil]
MADHSVSTVLCLTPHPSPGTSRSQARKPSGVDLCPSDKFPSLKRKREKIGDSGTDKSGSDEGGAKKQKGEGDGQWIKKRLSLSDVNDSSRLLLDKEYVRKYILPLMDDERRAACQSTAGLGVKVWDLDTISEHDLRLKQWKTGSFLLTSNWRMEFVKRRNLKEGDSIGLMWDFEKVGFFFHKFNAQS